MLTFGQQKVEPISLIAQLILAAIALVSCALAPEYAPFILAGSAGLVILMYWGIKWDATVWAWLWVLSYGLLDWPDWQIRSTGFFTITVPRLIFASTLLVFLFRWLAHRQRFRFDRLLLYAMLCLLLYVGASAQISGWRSSIIEYASAPYYRYLGSLLFPFLIFYLIYNTNISESEIKKGLILVTIYGWFALYIGYLQYIANHGFGGARAFIWPSYINDPEYGIHFDRARGAFRGASPQAVFMVLLFFVDLYLIRKLKGLYKALLCFQVILVPAGLLFTGVRSAIVGFVCCLLTWIFFANKGVKKWLILGVVFVVGSVGIYLTWDALLKNKRFTQDTISGRIDLYYQTMDIAKKHPLTGVGFGHFLDAQAQLEKDTSYGHHISGLLVEHNLWLGQLAETGIIGLFLTMLVYALLVHQSISLYKKLPKKSPGLISRELVVLFWVLLVNYFVDSMFRDPLWDVFTNGLLWSIAGLIVCCNRMLEPTPLELPIVPAGMESDE